MPLPLIGGTGASPTAASHPFELPEDASGHFDVSKLVVFGYSADAPSEDDPQVYSYLKPDMVLRSWFADRGDATISDNYNQDFRDVSQAMHVVFMAGVNASAIYPEQAPTMRDFDDWATRDAQDRAVTHPEYEQPQFLADRRTAPSGRGDIGAGQLQPPVMQRASLANPRFRARLLKQMETQIDLGADGIVLAESDALGYRGNKDQGYNGDEGYDRYFLSDFNRYLMDKYPGYSEADWEVQFQMHLNNTINPWFAWDDLRYNFNYQRYLKAAQWADDPRDRAGHPDRPLAAEWGDVAYPSAGPEGDDGGFLAKDLAYIQKLMILKIRKYARSTKHREIVVAAEGLLPDVDVNEYPLKRDNRDDGDKPVDYLPLTWNGSLKGSVSLLKAFKSLRARSRQVSGQALLVFYLGLGKDDYAKGYNGLSVEEKEDYWRLYVPEAYACGAFFAYHLRESLGQQPSSLQAGVIDSLCDDAGFYKRNRDLFSGAEDAGRGIRCDDANVACNVTEQAYWRRSVVHLINHNYVYKIAPVSDLAVTVASAVAPAVAYLRSPDMTGSTPVAFSFKAGQLTLQIPTLTYYDVVVLKWPVDGPRKRGEPLPVPTMPPTFADSLVPAPAPSAVAAPLPPELPGELPLSALPGLPLRPAGVGALRALGGPSARRLPSLQPSPAPTILPARLSDSPAPAAAAGTLRPTPLPTPSATACVSGVIQVKKRVWVSAPVGDTRALGIKGGLRLGRGRGDLKEYALPFSLTAPARVWAEADVQAGLVEGDADKAPEVFLDDNYLGPLLAQHWRSSRALQLEAGPHHLVLRSPDAADAGTLTLGRLRVVSDAVGRWSEVTETRPCGCGGPPCAPAP